jgi:hypothetical protein
MTPWIRNNYQLQFINKETEAHLCNLPAHGQWVFPWGHDAIAKLPGTSGCPQGEMSSPLLVSLIEAGSSSYSPR